MANTLITSSVVARAALATLYNSTVMLPLVYRDYEPEFQAGRGGTINVRKPATFTAAEYNGTTISVQNATESSVPVVLNHHRDTSFAVTSRDLALNIVDFNAQFLTPAMESIVQAVDADILGLRDDITNLVGDGAGAGTGTGFTTAVTDSDVLIDARTVLSMEKVPLGMDRFMVAPPTMTRPWLKEDAFKQADASGSTDALREASLGARIAGFSGFESNNISDGVGVAFHRTAFAFASRPLEIAKGVDCSIVNYKGMALRVTIAYDMNLKSQICSVDMLYGVKTLDAHRACLLSASGS